MSDTDHNLLKYCGSKAKLLGVIEPYIPKGIRRIYEPFCGSASLSLSQDKQFYLSDASPELINFLQQVWKNPEGLISALEKLPLTESDPEVFYRLREKDRSRRFTRMSEVDRAARYYYIIYCGYNGLYRVNGKGQCNTPHGGKRTVPVDYRARIMHNHIIMAERCLGIEFSGFEEPKTLESAVGPSGEDLFVFIDPAYYGTFDQYTKDRTSPEFWDKLFSYLDELDGRGIKFLMTNSYDPFILEKFGKWAIDKVSVKYTIAADGQKRGTKFEAFIHN